MPSGIAQTALLELPQGAAGGSSKSDGARRFTRDRIAWLLIAACSYFGAGLIGRLSAPPGSAICVVWPAAGIALALLFSKGQHLWPGIFAGSLLLQGFFPHEGPNPWAAKLVPFGIACAVTLQPVAGSALIRRFLKRGYPLGSVREFLLFLAAACITVLTAPLVAVATLCGWGVVPWNAFPEAAIRWFSSDLLGTLIGAPVVLVFINSGFPKLPVRKWVEFCSIQLLIGLFGATVFGPLGGGRHIQIGFVGMVLLLWAALSFGELGYCVGILILAGFVTWGTSHHFGPFTLSGPSFLTAQVFLLVSAGTGWLLTALWSERTRLAGELASRAEDLEERVRERTGTLIEAQQRLARAQKLARLGSWEQDLAANEIRWSEELCRIHGMDPGACGRTADPFLHVHPDDIEPLRGARERATQCEEAVTVEYRIVRADGVERHISETIQRPESGRPRLLGTAQDVTEYRHLQEELRQSQKMEAIGRLAGGVAHDFNNLLTIIIGNGVLLESESNEKHSPELTEILKAAERGGKLTSQLLAFSRRQVLQPKVICLAQVLAEIEPMLRRLIGEHIRLSIPGEACAGNIRADAHQLEQVIMNLAVNARDAMPAGGHLDIRVAAESLGEGKAEQLGLASGRYTVLSMSDTGVGISSEILPRIFEPFFTTKAPGAGTGLGLAMVYGIVKQSGGSIEVSSQEGSGTTFRLYFPVVEDEAAPPVRLQEHAGRIKGSARILLVEDEAAVRSVARSFLGSCGYRVFEAANGPEAISVARGLESIQLLVTDVIMPGMSGTQLAHELSKSYPGLRVLYISGYTGEMLPPEAIASMSSGGFVQKPFAPDALMKAVRDALERDV